MRSPKPPAPMNAAMVAVPTLITAEVLMPARSSARERQLDLPQDGRGVMPSDSAASPSRARSAQAGVGVAHDRQQRVEEERDQRRHHADAPISGIRNASKRERRHRLHDAGRAEDQSLQSAGRSRGQHAERHADDDARGQRQRTRAEVLERQAAEVGREQRLPEAA